MAAITKYFLKYLNIYGKNVKLFKNITLHLCRIIYMHGNASTSDTFTFRSHSSQGFF